MATKNLHPNHRKTVHQYIEAAFRHKMMLLVVVGVMCIAVANTDSRFRELMCSAYAEGMGFLSSYITHEHPSHHHNSVTIARMPTVSGPS